jgi:nuclear pore complex protein Nup205
LDIDELDAAELLLEAEDESEYSGQALQTCSIIRFHQRRKDLLDCLRLILELSDDENQEEYVRDHFQEYILELVQPLNGTKELKSFIQRCLDYMMHIRLRLQLVAEKLINFPEPAPASLAEQIEITRYRRVSLIKQHELLGFIVLCLVKKNHSRVTEFESVLKTMREWNTFNNLLGRQST